MTTPREFVALVRLAGLTTVLQASSDLSNRFAKAMEPHDEDKRRTFDSLVELNVQLPLPDDYTWVIYWSPTGAKVCLALAYGGSLKGRILSHTFWLPKEGE